MVDNLSPANGGFLSDENLGFRGDLDAWSPCFRARTDGRFGVREGRSESVAGTGASSSRRCRGSSGTRLGRIRPRGRDGAPSTGERSIFAPNAAAAAPDDSRSNAACAGLVSDDCTSGFEVVASLGRRRTSTVNEGIARLTIVLGRPHVLPVAPFPIAVLLASCLAPVGEPGAT